METFGLTIIEAFSNHCVVIASKIGAAEIIIKNGDNGFHYAPGDVRSLQKAIRKWANLDKEKKHQMYKNAYKAYQYRFSSKTQAKYFEKIYNIFEQKIQ
jgi:glycosyltransferase involved in cell wall biosynthesis